MSQIELSLLVSTYQRPWHLRRVLESIAVQENVAGRFEVVITDDGSLDHTQDMVREFARQSPFPLRMTSHPHDGFQLARCRNEGVLASSGEYILFLDGDCMIPRNHLELHLRCRRPRTVWGGHTIGIQQLETESVSLACIRSGSFTRLASYRDRRRLFYMGAKGKLYNWIRHPRRPKLHGGNIGIWRADYERINGYDEKFRGWGCEDDDLALRLRLSGMQIRSINLTTRTYHLWHEQTISKPQIYKQGDNYQYLNRTDRQARCEQGLDRPRLEQQAFEIVVDSDQPDTLQRVA
jgi:glycosyltransferase involved in cell wall biosynthesis